MADEFNIFNVSVDDLDTGEQENKGSDLYRPKPEQGKDGVYKSLIRFLPNPKNPRKPFIRKFVHWLEDEDGNGFYVDSPSTIGESCPIQDMFFKLRNSESSVDQKMSEDLKRKETYYALVQIVKDPQNSDLEGQIKVYKFGYKIKAKIDEELKPQFSEPVQVFDPFEGKNFELTIIKKGGFPNYDSSKFQGNTSHMQIDGEDVEDTADGRKKILEYLNDAPDLTNFEYTPWTDEERKKVQNVLRQYKSPGSSIDNLKGNETADDSIEEALTRNTPSSEKATADVVESDVEETTEDAGDELNDFLSDLDI